MKVADFAKTLAARPLPDANEDFEHDHSLGSIARQHAAHASKIHAGTAFDWEDLERYQEELERLDREGPGTSK